MNCLHGTHTQWNFFLLSSSLNKCSRNFVPKWRPSFAHFLPPNTLSANSIVRKCGHIRNLPLNYTQRIEIDSFASRKNSSLCKSKYQRRYNVSIFGTMLYHSVVVLIFFCSFFCVSSCDSTH